MLYKRLTLFLLVLQPLIANAQSIELDKRLGAENAQMVQEQMGIYNHAALTEYVRKVGNRLVKQLDNNPFEFRFEVVDDPTPNAFALPGGYVYVTRGILSLITTEDELAGVMAHEIIHVTQRHSIKQMKKSILPKLLELPGRVVGSVVNEDLGKILNAPLETSNKLLLADYSRKHETESDVKGIALAAKAGYDPAQLSVILDRLSKAVEILTEQQERKSYFDDHPYTPDRVRTIDKTVKRLQWNQAPPEVADFPQPLQGMLFGANPNRGVFLGNTFMHPDLSFTIVFPEGWETTNQPSSVGAVHPDRQAAIFVGLESNEKTPKEWGLEFVRKIKTEHAGTEIKSGPYSLNGKPAYLVEMVDASGSEPMYIHMVWMKMGNQVFKLVGLGPTRYEKALEASAESLHTITQAERSIILKTEFQVVEARAGETITSLIKRIPSAASPEVNAFLNGINIDVQLKKGQRLKILVERPY